MATLSRTRTVGIIVALVAVIGIGAWIAAPNAVVAALPFLLLAACPLAMMFMMGGMGHGQNHSMQQSMPGAPLASGDPDGSYGASDGPGDLTSSERIAALKARLARLEAEQAALAHQLAELEADRTNEVSSR